MIDPATSGSRRTAHLIVGTSGWALPIPLAQSPYGWRFGPVAARDETLTRRIGHNERAAMLTSLAYLDAQNDYRNQTRHYAKRLISTPGRHDGLYWPAVSDDARSPLGMLVAAMARGSRITKDGYHGYHYRILTRQGSNAKEGELDYVQDGVTVKDCALIAWPVKYGTTGVMSFMVNQDGRIYESNLGPHTEHIALSLKAFDPGPAWIRVQP